MNSVDYLIRNAEQRREEEIRRQEEAIQKWMERHILIRIGGQNYWLTVEVPARYLTVLENLPKDAQDDDTIPRNYQIKTRLSEDERADFDNLVAASGLTQSAYIRAMVLHGRLEVTQTSAVDQEALGALLSVYAELGRVAGMIRGTVIANKTFKNLMAEDKRQLEGELRDLRRIQYQVQTLAEKLYGNSQA